MNDRAHVTGQVSAVYTDATGHSHFSIRIGVQNADTVEVVYNEDFGALPHLQVGDPVEACGEYITVAQGSAHGQSPDGAIVHWVHIPNPARPTTHPGGYLVIEGSVYGDRIP